MSTVEQVHVYNSPGARSPIHLNNIMISVKRKNDDEPVAKTSKKSKDHQNKLTISEMKKFGLTSLNLEGRHKSMVGSGSNSPTYNANKHASLT